VTVQPTGFTSFGVGPKLRILGSKWKHFGELTAPSATGASVNWSATASVACPAAANAGRTAAGGRQLDGKGSKSTACNGGGGGSSGSWMQQVLAGGGGGAHPGWHEATQVRIVSVRRSATLAACA
jgi:hypothetical protein